MQAITTTTLDRSTNGLKQIITVGLYAGHCAACSAQLKVDGRTFAIHGQVVESGAICTNPNCGALHAHEDAKSPTLFSRFGEVADPSTVYFDVTRIERRIGKPSSRLHGWADRNTGIVIQIG